MEQQHSFSASTNKFAFAQAFAGPSAHRHSGGHRRHLMSAARRVALRGRGKRNSI